MGFRCFPQKHSYIVRCCIQIRLYLLAIWARVDYRDSAYIRSVAEPAALTSSSVLIYVNYHCSTGSWCDDVVKTLPVAESAAIIGFIVYMLQIHCSNVADTLTAAECWLGSNCGQGGEGVQSRP